MSCSLNIFSFVFSCQIERRIDPPAPPIKMEQPTTVTVQKTIQVSDERIELLNPTLAKWRNDPLNINPSPEQLDQKNYYYNYLKNLTDFQQN